MFVTVTIFFIFQYFISFLTTPDVFKTKFLRKNLALLLTRQHTGQDFAENWSMCQKWDIYMD